MSWIYGILQKKGNLNKSLRLKEECQSVEKHNFYLAIDEKSSLLYSKTEKIEAIVGLPIIKNNSKKKVLTKSIFNSTVINSPDVFDGHFIYLKFENEHLQIQNDLFGLREVYYLNTEKQFIFSSRIDLLIKNLDEVSFNIKEFSSMWLTNFQLSHQSVIKQIKRLAPGGKIFIDKTELQIQNHKFKKSNVDNSKELFKNTLSKFSSIQSDSRKISLGLSGGIDSRIVLAYLLKEKNDFVCHSLVNEEDKDLAVSNEICKRMNISLNLIEREQISLAEYESEILKFYKNIHPVIPVVQLLDFGIFGVEYLKKHLLLDGGFGGFYRGQYFKKIRLQGYKKFNIANYLNLKNSLYAPKPNIFSNDFEHLLDKNLNDAVKDFIDEFNEPKSNKEFIEILDYIAIYYMLPSVYSPGQVILDQKFTAFMPLVQKEIINSGLNIPFKDRVDSKFFKKLITETNSSLTKIGLVNNNLKNPYFLNYKLTMLRLLLTKKLYKKNNFERYNIIYNSKDFILDLFNTSSVKENKYLDNKRNMNIVNHFFKGQLANGYFVEWLLTFVLWSKANNIS